MRLTTTGFASVLLRRDETLPLPNPPHAAHGQSQPVKPMRLVNLRQKFMQLLYNELLAA